MDYKTGEIMNSRLGRRVVEEIIEQCNRFNEDVSQELAAFIIRIISTSPDYTYCIRNNMPPEEEENLVKSCCDLLLSKDNPSIDTIKMQMYFEVIYKNRDDFLLQKSNEIKYQAKPFLMQILQINVYNITDFNELENMIVSYFIVKTGMGSSYDRKLKQELLEILRGILPPSELRLFSSMEDDTKREQLHVLSLIILGIGIYNGRYKTGILNIDNIVVKLRETAPIFSSKLTTALQESKQYTGKLSSILENYILKSNKENWSTEMSEILNLLIEVLINVHQYENYLTTLLKETEICNKNTQELVEQLESTMNYLCEIISTTPEPIQQCSPSFALLTSIWLNMQDEVSYLNTMSVLANNIFKCAENSSKLMDDEKLKYLIENFDKVHETKSPPHTEDICELASAKNITIYFPVSIKNFSKMKLQYSGFCPWAICHGDGALLPTNREFGIILYGNKFFGFCCIEGRNEFLKDPDAVITNVITVAKKHPSLILFLQLHDRFILPFLDYDVIPEEKTVFTSECTTQTEDNIDEKSKSFKYKWNEWDFRREALQLAKLRNKKTHSTQCNQSHFRRDNSCQTYPLKDNFCQTKKDNSTTMSEYSLSNHVAL